MARRWTEYEDAVLMTARRNDFTTSQIFDANLLPGRSKISIQVRYNTLRCQRDGLCVQCGEPLPKEWLKTNCPSCTADKTLLSKRRNGDLKAEGKCTRCKRPLDEGSALTSYRKPRRREPRQRNAPQGFVRWAGSRSLRSFVQLFPRGYRVVDLFGGSGAYAFTAAQEGHPVVAWNDLHRGLYALMACLQRGEHQEVWEACEPLSQLSPEELERRYRDRVLITNPVDLAALTYIVALSAEGMNLRNLQINRVYGTPTRQTFEERGRLFQKYLGETKLLNLDYRKVVRVLDRPDTFFFCDPPFPGLSLYDHNFNGEHEELIETLKGLRGRFMLVLHSSRRSGELMSQLGEKVEVRLYQNFLLRGPAHIRELVAVNYDLDPLPSHLTPFDPSVYGL
jgi:DNA adenine methylase